MASTGETFGISYIEALALGVPIVYTEFDGIDGMITKKQGVGLSLKDFKEDVKRVIYLIENYADFENHVYDITFKWSDIKDEYIREYKMICKEAEV